MKKSDASRLQHLLRIRTADILALGTILLALLAGVAFLLWTLYG